MFCSALVDEFMRVSDPAIDILVLDAKGLGTRQSLRYSHIMLITTYGYRSKLAPKCRPLACLIRQGGEGWGGGYSDIFLHT